MASSSGKDARSSWRYWSIWACIVAQVLLWLRSSVDPDWCNLSDRNLNRFSAGVVDAEVDGVAVDDDAGVADVWWTTCCSQTQQSVWVEFNAPPNTVNTAEVCASKAVLRASDNLNKLWFAFLNNFFRWRLYHFFYFHIFSLSGFKSRF